MQAYEKLPNFTWDGSVRMMKGLATDISTYIGLGTLGAGVIARFAAKHAGKKGLMAYLKSTMPAATATGIEGGIFGSIDDASRQSVKIGAGKQDEFNLGQNLAMTGVGSGAGFTMGATFPITPTLIKKGAQKFGQALSRIQAEPNVLRSGVGPVDENVTKRVDVEGREVRTTKAARLNANERTSIDLVAREGNFKPSEIEAEYRRIKSNYPESEGWEKIELMGAKKKRDGSIDAP